MNSAAKRLASLDYEEVWSESLPLPDALSGAFDRGHGIWNYTIIIVVVEVFGNVCADDSSYYDATLSDLPYHDTISIDFSYYDVISQDEFIPC